MALPILVNLRTKKRRTTSPSRDSKIFARRNAVAYDQLVDVVDKKTVIDGLSPHPLALSRMPGITHSNA